MTMLKTFVTLHFILSGAFAARNGLLIPTAEGLVRGSLLVGNVRQFLGIPYAASTAGQNRFRPPVAPLARKGILHAAAFGPSCPQESTALNNAFGAIGDTPSPSTQNEDCLSVNIWAPAYGRPTGTAVMIWVHGGDFEVGSVSVFSCMSLRCGTL